MLAKSYVQAMTLRPLTHYDQDWEVVCFLCTEVPSLEAGTAELETTPDGGQGDRRHLHHPARGDLGRRHAR